MEQSRVVKELVAMWARNSRGNLMRVHFFPPCHFLLEMLYAFSRVLFIHW